MLGCMLGQSGQYMHCSPSDLCSQAQCTACMPLIAALQITLTFHVLLMHGTSDAIIRLSASLSDSSSKASLVHKVCTR